MTRGTKQSEAWVMEREGPEGPERFVGIGIRSGEFTLALCEAEGLAQELALALTRAKDPTPLPEAEPRASFVDYDVSADEVADALAALGLEDL